MGAVRRAIYGGGGGPKWKEERERSEVYGGGKKNFRPR